MSGVLGGTVLIANTYLDLQNLFDNSDGFGGIIYHTSGTVNAYNNTFYVTDSTNISVGLFHQPLTQQILKKTCFSCTALAAIAGIYDFVGTGLTQRFFDNNVVYGPSLSILYSDGTNNITTLNNLNATAWQLEMWQITQLWTLTLRFSRELMLTCAKVA